MNKKEYQEAYEQIWGKTAPDLSPRQNSILATINPENNPRQVHEYLREHPDSPDKMLARMGQNITMDRDEMLRIIDMEPRAYLYAHESLQNDKSFRLDAVARSEGVYDLVASEHQDAELMNAHRREGRHASYTMNPEAYYSIDAYEKAYEGVIKNGGPDRVEIHPQDGRIVTEMPQMQFMRDAERINPKFAGNDPLYNEKEYGVPYAEAKYRALKRNQDNIAERINNPELLSRSEQFIRQETGRIPADFLREELESIAPSIAEYILTQQEVEIDVTDLDAIGIELQGVEPEIEVDLLEADIDLGSLDDMEIDIDEPEIEEFAPTIGDDD